MYSIIKKFSYLPNEELGELIKIIIKYEKNEEIEESEKMKAFFKLHIQKDIERLLKQKKRTEKNRKEKKK